MGIKYILVNVEYVSFASTKTEKSKQMDMDNDDLALLKNVKISSSNN